MRSPFDTLPETGADDSWIYPDYDSLADFSSHDVQDPTSDEDMLELRTDPFVFASLSTDEYSIVKRRYGLNCESESMKEIARDLGVTHNEAKELLGGALGKMRDNFKTIA